MSARRGGPVRALALAIALAPLGTVPAWGAVDPQAAHADLERVRSEGRDAFCTHPPKPLDGRARELCGHARSVPKCDALVLACDEALPTPKAPWTPPPWLLDAAVGAVWVLLAAVVAVVAGFIVWLLMRARRDRAASQPTRPEQEHAPMTDADAPSPSDAEVLLSRADTFAREGALDAALAAYLRASLVALDARGALALGDDRTNGEYVRTCSDRVARAPLRDVVADVERVRFGHAAASTEVVGRVASRASAIVRALAILTLLVMPLAACDGGALGGGDSAGSDPAGTDLIEGVLAAQGVAVRSLPRPLAELKIPEDDETPLDPALVFVDLERTPLDADTRAHLAAWVEAGGTLITAGGRPPVVALHPTNAANARVIADGAAEAGIVLEPGGFEVPSTAACETVATVGERTPFAVSCAVGDGRVMAIAEDDLVANVGFARGANAQVALAILAHLAPTEIAFARREDGVAPPTSPLASLDRAGLRLGVWHALAAALLLFWAVGARLARPRPEPPPTRRAFVEHVEATGALYARARASARALESYVRFVEEHVRVAPGMSIASALATRTGAPVDECERLWDEAHDPEPGQELAVLGRLHALHARARRA